MMGAGHLPLFCLAARESFCRHEALHGATRHAVTCIARIEVLLRSVTCHGGMMEVLHGDSVTYANGAGAGTLVAKNVAHEAHNLLGFQDRRPGLDLPETGQGHGCDARCPSQHARDHSRVGGLKAAQAIRDMVCLGMQMPDLE